MSHELIITEEIYLIHKDGLCELLSAKDVKTIVIESTVFSAPNLKGSSIQTKYSCRLS